MNPKTRSIIRRITCANDPESAWRPRIRSPPVAGRGRDRRALGGIVGPAAFTAAWLVCTAKRRDGYTVRREHLSGLAAPDAWRPELMIGGFLGLGTGTLLFGAALEDALGGPRRAGPGPWLVKVAGVATLVAGLLRRDRQLLELPEGVTGQSWKNDGHDIAAGVIYACLGVAPLFLARRFRDDPEWTQLRGPAIGSAVTSGALMALFATQFVEPWNGIVQRVAVTVPMTGMGALAAHLLRRPPAV
jgi:Protein of unknown function (DUF998)